MLFFELLKCKDRSLRLVPEIGFTNFEQQIDRSNERTNCLLAPYCLVVFKSLLFCHLLCVSVVLPNQMQNQARKCDETWPVQPITWRSQQSLFRQVDGMRAIMRRGRARARIHRENSISSFLSRVHTQIPNLRATSASFTVELAYTRSSIGVSHQRTFDSRASVRQRDCHLLDQTKCAK